MHRFTFRRPACALASCLVLAAPLALAQQGADDASAAPDANAAHPSAPAASALPGVVLERNVFVPVDAAGKPTSEQFIVVERRTLAKDGDGGNSSGDAAASSDVPTRFILVPQQAGDDSSGGGSSGDGSGGDGSGGATQ